MFMLMHDAINWMKKFISNLWGESTASDQDSLEAIHLVKAGKKNLDWFVGDTENNTKF